MPISERDRRTLMIGGGVIGVLLVGFLLFNLLSGGGEEGAVPSAPPIDGSVVVPPPSTSPSIGGTPVPVFAGRDPFSVPPGLGPSGTSPTGGSPTVTTSISGSVTVTVTTTAPPTSPPPTAPGGSTTIGGRTVVLLDTFTQGGEPRVQVEVDGRVFNVGIGQPFAGGAFELQSVSGNCATFVYGDEPFTLCASTSK